MAEDMLYRGFVGLVAAGIVCGVGLLVTRRVDIFRWIVEKFKQMG